MDTFFYLILLFISFSYAAATAVNDPPQNACGIPISSAARSHTSATPPDLTQLSISARNLSAAQSLINSILSLNVHNSTSAVSHTLRMCVDYFLLGRHRILAALDMADKYYDNNDGNFEFDLPASAASDIRAWLGATLLYTYDCWSGLMPVAKETTQVYSAFNYLTELMPGISVWLSTIAAYEVFGNEWNHYIVEPFPTERDGCWQPNSMINSEEAHISNKIKTNTSNITRYGPTFVTVCKDDSSCQFKSVQAAVDASPANGVNGWYVVHIKQGVYEENVRVPYDKTNIEFVGDGMGKTVITGKLNADGKTNMTVYRAATVSVEGDGFRARRLTFANTAGQDAQQAVAFYSDSDFSFLEEVEFLGNRHTLYAHSLRQYYHRCRIVGTIDFIFGNSASIFESCNIIVLPNLQLSPKSGEFSTISAHGRTDSGQPTGFVFRNSVINGGDDYYDYYRQNSKEHKCYLGRAWKKYSRIIFIKSYMAEIIAPEGWLLGKDSGGQKTVFFGEHGNTGQGSNRSRRVPWSNEIPAEHVGIYSNQNFIQGDRWIPAYQ